MTGNAKAELRALMKAKRKALSHDELIKNSGAIAKKTLALPAFAAAKTVMLYMAAFNEPRTDEILRTALKCGKRVMIPVCDTARHTITASQIHSKTDLVRGAYGIPEPRTISPVPAGEADVMLIPGLAFGKDGSRLGFGEGYYDRTLASFEGIKIGVCHDFQLLGSVPSAPHDVKMDIIITERGVYGDL